MRDIIIWGAGLFGMMAYHYYKRTNPIIFFVDSDKRKWGSKIENIMICQPCTVQDYPDAGIVIAVKNYRQKIVEQLKNEYGITSYSVFDIRNEFVTLQEVKYDTHIPNDTVIITFSGGLGNQMFQYALAALNQKCGKTVMADLSLFQKFNVMDFQLEHVFSKIRLTKCNEKQKESLIEQNIKQTGKSKKFLIYQEPDIYDVKEKQADMSLLDVTSGIFRGYFQNFKYAEDVKEILLGNFQFSDYKEDKLREVATYIKEHLIVSIHIRRGDYLLENNKKYFGDICTISYYDKAMKYMRVHYPQCIFCLFSNDIAWVKENFDCEHNLVIDKDDFERYEDWYDMYLMSLCKHNIIANSTFSWWGAWLNQNHSKTVIAPGRWINGCKYLDIYPDDWIVF